MNNKHGMSRTIFYNKYRDIKRRCYDPNREFYKDYGGRGIKLCDRWQEFSRFKEDMYDSYLQHVMVHGNQQTTIERIDVNGDYSTDNCKWATLSEQAFNRRPRKYSLNGTPRTLNSLSIEFSIPMTTLNFRLQAGWSLEKSLYTPIRKYPRKENA